MRACLRRIFAFALFAFFALWAPRFRSSNRSSVVVVPVVVVPVVVLLDVRPAVVSAAVDTRGECEAGEDERHCGSSNRELHRRSFHSLHREEGCRDASQARAKPG
jgi:hypothetical protein